MILPAGLTFLSATPQGVYNQATGVWNVGTLTVGSTAVLPSNAPLKKTRISSTKRFPSCFS